LTKLGVSEQPLREQLLTLFSEYLRLWLERDFGVIIPNPFDRRPSPSNPSALHQWIGLSFGSTYYRILPAVVLIGIPATFSSVISIPTHDTGLSTLTFPYYIMNDTNSDSDANSISDSSNAHSDVLDASGNEAFISTAIRELCNRLRAGDPSVLNDDSTFELIYHLYECNKAGSIAIFQADKGNTIVKHIDFSMLFQPYFTQGIQMAAAEYVEFSKTLQTLALNTTCYNNSQDCGMLSAHLGALSRNMSVTKLIINTGLIRFVSDAFQEFLARTRTLQKMEVIHHDSGAWSQVQISAIAASLTIRRCVIWS
jgi:hypothetical protein